MNYSDRIDRVFAHGANPQYNYSRPGLKDPIINSEDGSLDSTPEMNGTTFSVNGSGLNRRAADEYTCESLSPLPGNCTAMEDAVSEMWNSEPTWGPEAFAKIQCPVWIVDGDHE